MPGTVIWHGIPYDMRYAAFGSHHRRIVKAVKFLFNPNKPVASWQLAVASWAKQDLKSLDKDRIVVVAVVDCVRDPVQVPCKHSRTAATTGQHTWDTHTHRFLGRHRSAACFSLSLLLLLLLLGLFFAIWVNPLTA